MTLESINLLSRDEFVGALGTIFEDSPWVAQRAFPRGPFGSPGDLLEAMTAAATSASTEEKLALLQAHPDLGTRAQVSASSAGEQAGAGLDRLTRAEYDELLSLNGAYKGKFGFPFIFAVKGSDKMMILEGLRARLQNTLPDEFDEALRQVFRIARFRLENLIDDYK